MQAVRRARDDSRVRADVDPLELATQTRVVGHRLAPLVAPGPLPPEALGHSVPVPAALLAGAGDQPDRRRTAVERDWGRLPLDRHG